MPTPVLATKLYIPRPRTAAVSRPRLIERLDDGLRRKLTLLSAPAGFGKTTLVSEWIAGCERREPKARVAWLSLDEGDSDPARFLTYLAAALQTLDAEIGGRMMGLLHSPQPPPAESILTALLNDIAAIAAIAGPVVLVLDDYHVMDSRPGDQALDFLLEHLPPHMHLVIATREDPRLHLARLRARGQLAELRAADLRFTPGEAADFLNRMMGLRLSAADIAALEARTEGWIAGLQLAALSMQGQPDPARFIQSFTGSHRFVLDYLMEEVLERQPGEIQDFLLRTSILDRLCGPLCEAVLSTPPGSGQSTLQALERANLFIVPLDNERRWYRYHHLFAELLRQRLGNPQELRDYHLRASAWLEASADLAAAFQHALAAGDFERAARLAEAAWLGVERSFQTGAWLGWVSKLPDAVVRSRPGLCVQLGWAYSEAGELEASETRLRHAEHALAGAVDQDGLQSLPGNIALIRASNAQNLGNLADTAKYAELSMRLIPEGDIYPRAQAAITLGFSHWAAGDLEASLRAMHAWMDDMHAMGNHLFVVASAFAAADMQVILGRLGEAEKALRQAIQLAAAQGREAEAVTAHHHLGLALLAHERGDEPAVTRHWQLAADLGQRTTLVDWPHRWQLAQARLKESAGEWEAALERLDEARRVYVKNPIPILQPVEARQARIYLKQGRLDKALAWAREQHIAPGDDVCYLYEYTHLTLARVRLSEGSLAGIGDLLERLLALAEKQKRTASVLEILLTQALADQAHGRQPQALAALERALALAEPEGYLRVFVDEGESMRRLLASFRTTSAAPAAHPLRGYVDTILAAFPQPAEIISRPTATPQTPGIIEPLTDRELEILRLVAEGQSNAEIGRRLYLALSTVKGHNLRIFGKLQAQNRTEAVARARELGLL